MDNSIYDINAFQHVSKRSMSELVVYYTGLLAFWNEMSHEVPGQPCPVSQISCSQRQTWIKSASLIKLKETNYKVQFQCFVPTVALEGIRLITQGSGVI